jgi:hypothetical protein
MGRLPMFTQIRLKCCVSAKDWIRATMALTFGTTNDDVWQTENNRQCRDSQKQKNGKRAKCTDHDAKVRKEACRCLDHADLAIGVTC